MHKPVRLFRVTLLLAALLCAAGLHAAPDTVSILAIRVDFIEDDDDFITGDGRFLLDTTLTEKPFGVDYKKYRFDPPPHNRSYFEKHLQALAAYYRSVSNGQLILSHSVYPAASDSAYHLPGKKKDYFSKHRSFSIALSDSQLTALAKAAVAAADSLDSTWNDSLRFDDYDCLMIFHAGADGRTDQDDSYGDIPSKYVNLAQYDDSLEAADGTVMREFLLFPETISQDGVIGVLNATLAYEFGHYLGLPSLYFSEEGTNYGVPAVGFFSLMDVGPWLADSGEVYVYGAVPPLPGPWERIRLGWTVPVELPRTDDSAVYVSPAVRGGGVYRVPLSTDEYYLIEYREPDINGDAQNRYVQDSVSGVIMSASFDTAGGDTVYEHDALLPGGGLAVWHVDESAFKTVNGIPVPNHTIDRQGIDVIEADGSQDIGYVLTYGSKEDFFYPREDAATSLTPSTRPNTDSRSGAVTNIAITGIDTADSGRMKFAISFTGSYKEGWPRQSAPVTGAAWLGAADLTGNDTLELVAGNGTALYAWKPGGKGLAGSTGVFASCAVPLAGAPALGDVNGDLLDDVAVIDSAGSLHVWSAAAGTAAAVTGFPVYTGGPANLHPLLYQADGTGGLEILAGTENGDLLLLKGDGSTLASLTFTGDAVTGYARGNTGGADDSAEVAVVTAAGVVYVLDALLADTAAVCTLPGPAERSPVLADMDADGKNDIIAASGRTLQVLDGAGVPLPGWPVTVPDSIASPLAVGDADGDGTPEILFYGNNTLHAYNRAGNPLTGFPRTINRSDPEGYITPAPVLGNGDSDAGDELVYGSPVKDMTIKQLPELTAVSGWPRITDPVIAGTPLLADLEGDGIGEVAAVSAGGAVQVWETGFASGGGWPTLAADMARTGCFDGSLQTVSGSGALVEGLFNYPNPTTKDHTTIRYYVGSAGVTVNITIHDFSGELVTSFDGPAIPYTDNETVWDVSDIQSGVYYCRVKATAGSKTKTVFCRIGVVK